MRHGPISRAAFCKEIAEETFDLSPKSSNAIGWGCCGLGQWRLWAVIARAREHFGPDAFNAGRV